jgi:DNA-binding transcriptional LysR family regulator
VANAAHDKNRGRTEIRLDEVLPAFDEDGRHVGTPVVRFGDPRGGERASRHAELGSLPQRAQCRQKGGRLGMEVRHLRYFVAVAEELHFSRAAERLHVSQPPLSQQIKQLEEEVKVQFDRSTRWVRLTSAGRLFLEYARQVLAQVESAVLAARGTLGRNGDRLSVASSPWADLTAVPRILRRFSGVRRHIQIDAQTLNSVRQARAVKARTVDVGFMLPPAGDEDLQMERLATYTLVVALPANHPLAARAQLSPGDLARENYLALASDVAPAYGEIVGKYWDQAGVAMKERLKADPPHAVIDLVAAGAGFALCRQFKSLGKSRSCGAA